jgi:hypothetical protein
MESPWRARERRESKTHSTQKGFAAIAKRDGGAMSHHSVCQPSANGLPHHPPSARSSYTRASPPPPSLPLLHSSRARSLRPLFSLLLLLATCASLFVAATAQETSAIGRRSAPLNALAPDDLDPSWKGPSLLILDTRPPPESPLMHLQRRQRNDASSSSTSTPTASAAASKSSLATDPSATKTPFTVPQPFDTALSSNFTSACATFFRRLLTEPAFKQCHPFSLMLQVRLSHLAN